MSLLRGYCLENYNISYAEFNNLSLEERERLSRTWGYQMQLSVINVDIAWNRFKDSLFESIDSKFYKWLLKICFKLKGIK